MSKKARTDQELVETVGAARLLKCGSQDDSFGPVVERWSSL